MSAHTIHTQAPQTQHKIPVLWSLTRSIVFDNSIIQPQHRDKFNIHGCFIGYENEGTYMFKYDMIVPEFRDHYDDSGAYKIFPISDGAKRYVPFFTRMDDACWSGDGVNDCMCTCGCDITQTCTGDYSNCENCTCNAYVSSSSRGAITQNSVSTMCTISKKANMLSHLDCVLASYAIKLTETAPDIFTVDVEVRYNTDGKYNTSRQHTFSELQYTEPLRNLTNAVWQLVKPSEHRLTSN